MMEPRTLIAIFHKPGQYDANVVQLKHTFRDYDIYLPQVSFYGNKWKATRSFFKENNYDSLFVICSDVSIVCGNIAAKVRKFAADKDIGVYGFGTIMKFTFPWLQYNNMVNEQMVPFVEGYCFGVNKTLIGLLEEENIYGYGIDVEMGYRSHMHGLKCVVNNEVCIRHEFGKTYSDEAATREYVSFLLRNRDIHNFLRSLNIYTPLG